MPRKISMLRLANQVYESMTPRPLIVYKNIKSALYSIPEDTIILSKTPENDRDGIMFLHELIHAAGSPARMNIPITNVCREEVVAYVASALGYTKVNGSRFVIKCTPRDEWEMKLICHDAWDRLKYLIGDKMWDKLHPCKLMYSKAGDSFISARIR